MPAEPYSWNAVVVGAWNRAILSPDGIRVRLFELPAGTPIELELAVDQPGQFRVSHEGVIVVPGPGRLEISAREPDAASLERACTLCRRALQRLPETPVSAAGVNIRYRFAELPDVVFDLMRAPIDGTLSDAGFQVAGGSTKRSVVLDPGVVNISIDQRGAEGSVELNFHRESASPTELADWLARVGEFINLSQTIAEALGVLNVRREIHQ